jgi:ABC-type lipoprotein export system ATPase subunit
MSAQPEVTSEAAVEARGISIDFGGERILERVDLDIEVPGELLISGRSGSGKTTLMLILAGLLQPSTGTVAWPGLSPDPHDRRQQMAVIFQAPSLIAELTAGENICLPLRLRGWSRAAAAEAEADVLERVGLLPGHGQVLPSEMSGGEQQRVSVARAIATRPCLLFADEPTGALDRTNATAIISALRQSVRRDGASLVVSTHDEEIAGLFTRHLAVENRDVRWVRR